MSPKSSIDFSSNFAPAFFSLSFLSLLPSACPSLDPPTSEFSMARKKRTATQVFGDAKTNGLKTIEESSVNEDEVHLLIQDRTSHIYNQMLDLRDDKQLRIAGFKNCIYTYVG